MFCLLRWSLVSSILPLEHWTNHLGKSILCSSSRGFFMVYMAGDDLWCMIYFVVVQFKWKKNIFWSHTLVLINIKKNREPKSSALLINNSLYFEQNNIVSGTERSLIPRIVISICCPIQRRQRTGEEAFEKQKKKVLDKWIWLNFS